MRIRADISIGNLLAAAFGGIAAALVLSYFGAAGSLVGAAVGPVVYLLVKELSRPPTETALARAGRSRRAGDQPSPLTAGPVPPPVPFGRLGRRRGLAWLLATAGVATLVAVALITVPELISGRSLTGGDRSTTFFDSGGGSGGGGVTTVTVTEPATETPAEPAEESAPATETPTTEAAPATEEPTTAPAPATEEAPVTDQAPPEPAPQTEVAPAEPVPAP
jgi:hypothetical protein